MATVPTKAEASVLEYSQYLQRARSEASFQRALEDFAKLMGWLVFHDRDSRKNNEGFPDFVGVRDGRVVYAELKVGKNTRTAAQEAWGDALTAVADASWLSCTRYYLWYPRDWEEIVRVIKQPWIEVELT